MLRLPMLAVVAILALLGAQFAADARLRPDWNDLVSAAAQHGLILSGTAQGEFGALRVTDVCATGTSFAPNTAIRTLVLRRSLFDLFRLSITPASPINLVFPSGQQVDLWSDSFRITSTGQRWRFSGTGVGGALHDGGPDDAASFGTIGGHLAEYGDGWRLAFRATGVALPARGAWPNGRLVERLSAALIIDPATDRLVLERAAATWGGQRGRLSFTGALDDRDLVDGRGQVALGPGWADTLKRAHTVGALDAGEAAAAIGFLGLLTPDQRSPVSFPIEVDAGHVRVGPTVLFNLPAMPMVR